MPASTPPRLALPALALALALCLAAAVGDAPPPAAAGLAHKLLHGEEASRSGASLGATAARPDAAERQAASTGGEADGATETAEPVFFPRFTWATCTSLPTLVCHVQPTEGYGARGAVYFTPSFVADRGDGQSGCHVRVRASVGGLNASSLHGFHVHTFGDIGRADGSSTGGHFSNPAGDELAHGWPDSAVRHWGDFGNLTANADGVAEYDRVDDVIRLGAVLGRAVTIHSENDKGPAFQPSGASGARIGFCVIGYANPAMLASA